MREGGRTMKKVVKKTGKEVLAYKLNTECDALDRLIQEGKLKRSKDGMFEVFSREVMNGKGELVCAEDYIKIDNGGYPYPNKAKFFEENHKHIEGNRYVQIPKPLDAWFVSEGMCPEIQFLIEQKGLMICESVPEKYFEAPLWGTILSAPRDAVVIFYELKRDSDGTILDADFNFVVKEEFEKTYDIVIGEIH